MLRAFALFFIAASAFAAPVPKAPAPPPDLVGVWKLEKAKDEALPAGVSATIEFAKDGTMRSKISLSGEQLDMKGTWKRDGDKVTLNITEGANASTRTIAIVTLTADTLVTKTEQGLEETFVRVKDEKK